MSETALLSGIKAVLFDFGGVLAELRAEAHLLSLMKSRMTREVGLHVYRVGDAATVVDTRLVVLKPTKHQHPRHFQDINV